LIGLKRDRTSEVWLSRSSHANKLSELPQAATNAGRLISALTPTSKSKSVQYPPATTILSTFSFPTKAARTAAYFGYAIAKFQQN
jgi:hypothetical protein